MSFTMGYAPQEVLVVLTPGSDFVCTLSRTDGEPWAPGLKLTLDLGGVHAWDAELSGTVATWVVDELLVRAAITSAPANARLWYVDGGTRLLWASGHVSVRP